MSKETDDMAMWYQQLADTRRAALLAGIIEERERVLSILNAELNLHSKGSSGAGTIQRIIAKIEVSLE